MEKTFARTEGRCSDCTLEFRLKSLQVLRFVTGTCNVDDQSNCAEAIHVFAEPGEEPVRESRGDV